MDASLVVAAGTDVRVLAEALGRVGVSEAFVLNSAVGDHLLFDPSPDMVVGVLKPNEERTEQPGLSNLDVMLRMGRAVDRGIPALLIVPPPMESPTPMAGISYALCSPDSDESLGIHLWAFVSNIQAEALQSPDDEWTVDAARYREALNQIDDSEPHALQFERIIGSLLSAAGAAVQRNPDLGPSAAVDFAFIPSGDSDSVYLGECKMGNLSDRLLTEAEEQLQSFVISRRAQLGVVIYYDRQRRKIPARRPTPLMVRISADELLDGLSARSLSRVLSDAASEAARSF